MRHLQSNLQSKEKGHNGQKIIRKRSRVYKFGIMQNSLQKVGKQPKLIITQNSSRPIFWHRNEKFLKKNSESTQFQQIWPFFVGIWLTGTNLSKKFHINVKK